MLALGTPGSYGILQTQVQAMVQHLDFGLPLQEAIEAPRARLVGRPRRRAEPARAAGVEALRARGHEISRRGLDDGVGGMQAVAIDPATGRDDRRRRSAPRRLLRAGSGLQSTQLSSRA